MTRNHAIALLAALIDAERATEKTTHISLNFQDNKLAMLAHPMQFAADGETLVSSHLVIEVNHKQQVDGRVSTGDHEIPARAADSVRVAQALLDDLEENLTGSLFA
ncbi:TPA: hypothetical protein ACGY8I_001539 [Aeromonas hydrophila]|uniref:hypothetical protein n=1 Tax=Aeromonas hydrophila TaxID=644 RepID=UPI00049324C5|nr:hypothetical protein [Aeromonas hydrophila]QWL80018.1 hypothetical protein HQ395_15275 [Aeromonas hydrophila]